MSEFDRTSLDLEAVELAADEGDGLVVDLEGYEGPLHVLLALARKQKVDLLGISILKLADQYLIFVRKAQRLNFSLAADYLVMAAWLAYLKSRLLLPRAHAPAAEGDPEDMAAALAFSLAKLDAMRQAVEALKDRAQLGRDVFVRGDPEAVKVIPSTRLEGDLYSLMDAYANQVKRTAQRSYAPRPPQAYALEAARERLRSLLSDLQAWTPLAGVAPFRRDADGEGPTRASYLASTLAASLELVKDGAMEARQLDAFAEVYLRARQTEQAA